MTEADSIFGEGGSWPMETIIAWISTHPILFWSVAGIITVVALLALVCGLTLMWVFWRDMDRSGAKLVAEDLTILQDADEVVFTLPLRSSGKFAARKLDVRLAVRAKQMNGLAASWSFGRGVDVLEPGERIDICIRISRYELSRLSHDFDRGQISLQSSYSSSSPKGVAEPFGVFGPSLCYALAVGEVGGEACVTVTDFTPVNPADYYHRNQAVRTNRQRLYLGNTYTSPPRGEGAARSEVEMRWWGAVELSGGAGLILK